MTRSTVDCRNMGVCPRSTIISFYLSISITYTPSSAFHLCMALNGLLCADVPLRTYTLTLSMSMEQLKLWTSNLMHRLTMRSTVQNAKLGQKGRDLSPFKICGPTQCIWNRWRYKRQIWCADWSQGVISKICKSRSNRYVAWVKLCTLKFWDPSTPNLSQRLTVRHVMQGAKLGQNRSGIGHMT